jgi:hypothetical protein
MISRKSVELQAPSPSKNLSLTPVQQIPLRPHTQHSSLDSEDHTTQADEQGKPTDHDGHTISSDDEPHQSQILGNPKKVKKNSKRNANHPNIVIERGVYRDTQHHRNSKYTHTFPVLRCHIFIRSPL